MDIIKQLLPLSIILAVSFPSTFSQGKREPSDESNLYYRALFATQEKYASISKELKANGYPGALDCEGRICDDPYIRIVERNVITKSLPTKLGEYQVEYLDDYELVDRYKKLRKEFSILVAYPMKNDGERLVIGFNHYWFSYKKRRRTYSLESGV